MTSRDDESAMLDRCAAAAVGELDAASDQREANIFRLAALVLGPRFDAENRRLMLASERYFKEHPADVVPSVEVVRRGWIIGLPRLRDMLTARLRPQDPGTVMLRRRTME